MASSSTRKVRASGSVALPVVQPGRPHPGRGLRPRRPGRWRTICLLAVNLAIVGHVVHWLVAGRTLSPLEPSEAMQLVKDGVLNAGAVFFIAAVVLTAVFGRFVCGWGCHLLALQDLCRWLLLKLGIRPRPLRSRLLGWVPALAFLYMFVWPAAYRLWACIPYHGFSSRMTTSNLWATFPGWVFGAVTFAVCGFAIVFVLGSKGFCTYACPYGAAFAVADRLAPLRIRVTDACQGCARCTAACSSNVRVHEQVRSYGAVLDPGCMKCMDCITACPNDALYLGLGRPALATSGGEPRPRPHWSLSWTEEMTAAAAFVASFVVLRGLYGVLPFLLSLGAAAILAAATVATLRLAHARDVRFGPARLKAAGDLRPAGRVFVAVLAPAIVLLGHSAVIHWSAATGHRLVARTSAQRDAILDLEQPLTPATGTAAALAAEAVSALGRARRWGLFDDPTLDGELAWLYLLVGDREAAASSLTEALGRQPGSVPLNLLDGRLRAAGDDPRGAVAAYGRALASDPASVPAYLGLGTVLGQSGALADAVRVFERGVAVAPDVPELHYDLGVARAMQGDAAGAIAGFQAALALDPDDRRARENLAGVLLGTGQPQAALDHLEIALDAAPNDVDTRLMAASAALELGDGKTARRHLEAALAIAPDLAQARAMLARLPPAS